MESITIPSISSFTKPKMKGGYVKKERKTKQIIDLTSEISTDASTSSDFVPNVVSSTEISTTSSSTIAPNIMKGGQHESVLQSTSSNDSDVFNEIYAKSKGGAKKTTQSSEYSGKSKSSKDSTTTQYSDTSEEDDDKESELLKDTDESVNFKPSDLDDNTTTVTTD